MSDKIILVCCAIFLPLGLIVANSLINRTQIRQKDRQIESLKRESSNLAVKKETAEKAERAQQKITQVVGQFVHTALGNSDTFAGLAQQAKQVSTEQDAIELARRQVEVNNR